MNAWIAILLIGYLGAFAPTSAFSLHGDTPYPKQCQSQEGFKSCLILQLTQRCLRFATSRSDKTQICTHGPSALLEAMNFELTLFKDQKTGKSFLLPLLHAQELKALWLNPSKRSEITGWLTAIQAELKKDSAINIYSVSKGLFPKESDLALSHRFALIFQDTSRAATVVRFLESLSNGSDNDQKDVELLREVTANLSTVNLYPKWKSGQLEVFPSSIPLNYRKNLHPALYHYYVPHDTRMRMVKYQNSSYDEARLMVFLLTAEHEMRTVKDSPWPLFWPQTLLPIDSVLEWKLHDLYSAYLGANLFLKINAKIHLPLEWQIFSKNFAQDPTAWTSAYFAALPNAPTSAGVKQAHFLIQKQAMTK